MAKFEVLTDVEWGWCTLYRLDELGHVVMPGWCDDHGTKQFGPGVTLKPRELDALATKSAAVQALAEAAGNIVTELATNAAPYEVAAALRLVNNRVTLDHALLLPLVLAYKSFESTDA